ncbi:hypothetical protein F5X99DRAFT_384839 [Biscogniauxia marginata]|nr:hypothetical protein F5X99DRAFT_384839 [Biscogniauxia marginata]
MAPTTTVSVAYPAGTKFNMDYYLKSHMPLVQSKWTPYGLKVWRVAQYDNAESPYVVQAWLEFENAEGWAKASGGAEAKDIFGDIVNFSDKEPIVLVGVITGAVTV